MHVCVPTPGEQHKSTFPLWQSASAKLFSRAGLCPDNDRRDLWAAVESYVDRERRYGGAVDAPGLPEAPAG